MARGGGNESSPKSSTSHPLPAQSSRRFISNSRKDFSVMHSVNMSEGVVPVLPTGFSAEG